jgi:hypothetical protein
MTTTGEESVQIYSMQQWQVKMLAAGPTQALRLFNNPLVAISVCAERKKRTAGKLEHLTVRTENKKENKQLKL